MKRFLSLDELRDACRDLPRGNPHAELMAAERQERLTKPSGSLGRLEELAVWMARWQGASVPVLDHASVVVFAGNHGVAERGVSAFPSEVTVQMVANFASGGAAINQLATLAEVALEVVPLKLDEPTADFVIAPAMSEDEFLEAASVGWDAVPEACQLLAVGEMGIGNTTAASALCAALLGGDVASWVGRGTGVGDDGLARKVDAVGAGIERHRAVLGDPLATAMALGGRELAAILGAVLGARHRSVPVLLDGFVTSAAVLPLFNLDGDTLSHCRAAHCSAEAAHGSLLRRLGLEPLLTLGMRLGEGSGAALGIQVVRAALACHARMATFDGARVSDALKR